MQKILISSFLLMASLGMFAQTTDNGEILKIKEVVGKPNTSSGELYIFDGVEMPQFPGGPDSLRNYFRDNLKYPLVAQENGVQGRVVVSFIVERDGSLTDVMVVKSVDPSLDKEAIRIVSSMPKWMPAKLKENGKTIRVKYDMPVSFYLQ